MKYKTGDMVNIVGEDGIFEIVHCYGDSYKVYNRANKCQYDMVDELDILPLRNENKLIWHSYKEKPTEEKQYLCYVLEPDSYGLFEEKYYVMEWILEKERWELCCEVCIIAWAEINRPELEIRLK